MSLSAQNIDKRQWAARRHTKLVRILRITLPGLGIAALIGLILHGFVMSYLGALRFGPVKLTANGLVIENPNLSGSNEAGSFKISAGRAIQRLYDTRIFELEDMQAEFAFNNGVSLILTARHGILDQGRTIIRLRGGIRVTSSKGHIAQFETLTVAFENGVIETTEPLTLLGSRAELAALKMRLDFPHNHIVFKGPVHLRINRQPAAAN